MTAANLLAHLLMTTNPTVSALKKCFGSSDWRVALDHLRDLRVIRCHPDDDHIYISGWNGQSFGH